MGENVNIEDLLDGGFGGGEEGATDGYAGIVDQDGRIAKGGADG